MLRILLLDNYDSFTYNLQHYLAAIDAEVIVRRNDDVNMPESFDAIVFSPGPGLPKQAGFMNSMIKEYAGRIPILGVCLGMQAIAEFLGGEVYNQKTVRHGVKETVILGESALYKGISKRTEVGLYHSWAVTAFDNGYYVNAKTEQDVVMGIENRDKMMYGVQFHPESIMTTEGRRMLENFVDIVKAIN